MWGWRKAMHVHGAQQLPNSKLDFSLPHAAPSTAADASQQQQVLCPFPNQPVRRSSIQLQHICTAFTLQPPCPATGRPAA